MKKMLVLIATASLLSACASNPNNDQVAPSYAADDADLQYVKAVEYAAERTGADVVWINRPRSRASKNR